MWNHGMGINGNVFFSSLFLIGVSLFFFVRWGLRVLADLRPTLARYRAPASTLSVRRGTGDVRKASVFPYVRSLLCPPTLHSLSRGPMKR